VTTWVTTTMALSGLFEESARNPRVGVLSGQKVPARGAEIHCYQLYGNYRRGPGRTRTGDCGFRAWKTLQSAFVSVAELGGSDSLLIRLSEINGGELYRDA
jgi:hypothetical protein